MDEADTYGAMQWFAAGYLAADPDEPRAGDGDLYSEARVVAGTYINRYRRGRCLSCGRGDLALMDGMFCQSCFYPPEQAAPDLFEEADR